MVYCLFIKSAGVIFCWIPSHCGLTFSEWVDRAAKRGAINNMQSVVSKQMCNIIESYVETIRIQSICHFFFSSSEQCQNVRRTLSSLVYRLLLSDVPPPPPPPPHTHTKEGGKKKDQEEKITWICKAKTKITIIFYATAS